MGISRKEGCAHVFPGDLRAGSLDRTSGRGKARRGRCSPESRGNRETTNFGRLAIVGHGRYKRHKQARLVRARKRGTEFDPRLILIGTR